MQDQITFRCPYCDEAIELYVDPETTGSMVEDCEVCCRPYEVLIVRDPDGTPRGRVGRAQ